MLLLIQAAYSDYERLPQMADLLTKLGPYPNHRAAVLHTQDVPTQSVEEFLARIRPLFAGVNSEAIRTNSKGWPHACNQSFQKVAQWMATKLPNPLPWYNFELDNVPLQKGWLDALQKEYDDAKKDFMGVIVNTRGLAKDSEGKMVSVPTGEKHMVGTGIYPPQYGNTSVKVPFLARHMIWGGRLPEPYDVQIRHEVVPYAHHTNLIAHRFKTVNYRVVGDKLVCDNAPDNPATADHSAPIPPGTLVVHGVKDDSLAKWVLAGGVIPTPAAKAPEPVQGEPEPAKTEPLPVSKDKPSFIVHRVKSILKDGNPRRLPKLAEELGVDKELLRKEIEAPNSGLEIINPGWVRVKTVSQSP